MRSTMHSIKTLLRVSVQILLAVFAYFLFMWLQAFFNKLPYNLSLLGPLLLFVVLILLKRSWLQRSCRFMSGIRYSARALMYCILSILFFVGFALLMMLLYSSDQIHHYAATVWQNISNPVPHISTLLQILIPAALEEVLCRFLILALLIHNGMNRYWSILISSIVFSLCHGQYNYYILVYIVAIGVVLAMLYLIFKNLGVAIGLHFTINYFVHINPDDDPKAYDLPESFVQVWQENTLINYFCILVLLLWIYTQYIRRRKRPGRRMR
mgnify:FL=1